jgi:hypothetical protein
MNRSHLLAAIIFLCLSSLISAQSVEFNGLWLGYEPFKYKGDDWFFENLLSIKDGVVHLVKKPETRADDGNIVEYASGSCGDPVFRGRLVARGNVTVAVLEIESCYECDEAGKKAWRVPNYGVLRQGAPKDYPIQLNSRKSLKLNGVTFRRVKKFPL